MVFVRLRRYWMAAAGLSLFFLVLFAVAEAIGIGILTDPSGLLTSPGFAAAAAGVILLIADVWLPVPASIIMIALGTLFGIWVGTLLSIIGSVGASLIGFWIGRASNDLIKRLVTPDEYQLAATMLNRWGALAVIVTRPVPILAETVAILAGASPIKWRRHAFASFVGAFPAALLYAWAGATASNFGSGVLVFVMVLLLAGVFWWIGKILSTRHRLN